MTSLWIVIKNGYSCGNHTSKESSDVVDVGPWRSSRNSKDEEIAQRKSLVSRNISEGQMMDNCIVCQANGPENHPQPLQMSSLPPEPLLIFADHSSLEIQLSIIWPSLILPETKLFLWAISSSLQFLGDLQSTLSISWSRNVQLYSS